MNYHRNQIGRYAPVKPSTRFFNRLILKVQHILRIGLVVAVIAWLMLGSLKFGIAYASHDTLSYVASTLSIPIAQAETVKPVEYPILDKIARAESLDNQFCTKELAKRKIFAACTASQIGAPLIRTNTNGTYDIGKYQINSTHLADAIAHGYDVYTLEGNTAYAVYLFTTQGSEPWYSSKSNWK